MTNKTSHGTRLGLAALGLTLLAAALPAAAFDRTSDAGQRAVRDLIRSRTNKNTTVVFQSTQSRNSGGDTLVSGRGYTRRGNGNGRNSRDFTYTVNVERNGNRARNAVVRFENGETYRGNGGGNDNGGWPGNGNDARRPTIVKPQNGFTDQDGDVTFEGRSESRNVTLTITPRDGNGRGTTRRVAVRDGRWSTNVRLSEGSYRARVTNDGRAEFDSSETVDFRVDGGRNGGNDERATFDRPENNFTDRDGEIRFSGDSEGRQVELRVYRGNREVLSRRLDVRDDRWDFTTRLDNGDYRATIRTVDGRGTATIRFRVDRD